MLVMPNVLTGPLILYHLNKTSSLNFLKLFHQTLIVAKACRTKALTPKCVHPWLHVIDHVITCHISISIIHLCMDCCTNLPCLAFMLMSNYAKLGLSTFPPCPQDEGSINKLCNQVPFRVVSSSYDHPITRKFFYKTNFGPHDSF